MRDRSHQSKWRCLAGKILGPIAFVLAVQSGELPLRMILLVALNDWIWWTPFALYLIDGTRIAAALGREAPRIADVVDLSDSLSYACLVWGRDGPARDRSFRATQSK